MNANMLRYPHTPPAGKRTQAHNVTTIHTQNCLSRVDSMSFDMPKAGAVKLLLTLRPTQRSYQRSGLTVNRHRVTLDVRYTDGGHQIH